MWNECNEDPNYEVSDSGEVRRSGRLLKRQLNRYGYLYVSLANKKYTVHRLVASAFIGDITGKEIDHIDTNRVNNHVSNLRIVSRKENANNPKTIESLKKHGAKYAKLYGRPVSFGDVVYPSIIEAHRATNIPRSNIQYHLKMKTGVWKYV